MKKCTSSKEQEGTRYIWGKVYSGIIAFSCLSSVKLCLRFILICFAQEIKSFYQSSLGNMVDFRDTMDVSPDILAKKIKFQETETHVCRWKSIDSNDINIFLSQENHWTFLLVKEKTWKHIFNTNSELSQNCIQKHIMLSKAIINWLFNDIRCYLLLILIEKLANWHFSTNSCQGLLYL